MRKGFQGRLMVPAKVIINIIDKIFCNFFIG